MRTIERRPVGPEAGQNGLAGSLRPDSGRGLVPVRIVAVILLNAVVIGLETYDSIDDGYGDELRA